MRRPEVRAQVSRTLKAMGWGPVSRGGNGRGPTPQEKALAEALDWPTNVIVPTGSKGKGYPTHYKIDVGNPTLQVAIEIDGHSHDCLARRAQDRKKDGFLRGIGWTVFRFTNAQVDESVTDCAQTVLSTTLKSRALTTTSPKDG